MIVPLLERDEEKWEAAVRPHPALNYWNRSRLGIFSGEIPIHRDLVRDFASHSLSGVISFFSSVSTTNTASRRAG
jgi:hypothetical protein